jgi:acyl carrier protein
MTVDGEAFARPVIDLWQKALGVDNIASDDDFFDLGGNSITAIRMLPLISDAFGVEVDAMFIFDNPTPEEFMAALAPILPAAPGRP